MMLELLASEVEKILEGTRLFVEWHLAIQFCMRCLLDTLLEYVSLVFGQDVQIPNRNIGLLWEDSRLLVSASPMRYRFTEKR